MGRRRFNYVLILALALGFYVAYSLWFSWYLLVLVALLPLFDLALSLPGMLTRRVKLTAPRIAQQGRETFVRVIAAPRGKIPAGQIKARLVCVRDGEASGTRFVCASYEGEVFKLKTDTARSGLSTFALRRFWAVSFLGLFALPIPARLSARMLVLPVPAPPPDTVPLERAALLRPKPGGGFSEEHDMRPYRPGDPIRAMHWKLSAKHDEMIVREPLAPPEQLRLVRCASWSTPDEREIILARLLWASAYLTERGLTHYVKLSDFGAAEITAPGDLTDYLFDAFTGVAVKSPNAPARFNRVFSVDARQVAK